MSENINYLRKRFSNSSSITSKLLVGGRYVDFNYEITQITGNEYQDRENNALIGALTRIPILGGFGGFGDKWTVNNTFRVIDLCVSFSLCDGIVVIDNVL